MLTLPNTQRENELQVLEPETVYIPTHIKIYIFNFNEYFIQDKNLKRAILVPGEIS